MAFKLGSEGREMKFPKDVSFGKKLVDHEPMGEGV